MNVPEDPKERRGLLPTAPATQTENAPIDSRNYIYISDRNHRILSCGRLAK